VELSWLLYVCLPFILSALHFYPYFLDGKFNLARLYLSALHFIRFSQDANNTPTPVGGFHLFSTRLCYPATHFYLHSPQSNICINYA
jgi:hypothetical protein